MDRQGPDIFAPGRSRGDPWTRAVERPDADASAGPHRGWSVNLHIMLKRGTITDGRYTVHSTCTSAGAGSSAPPRFRGNVHVLDGRGPRSHSAGSAC